MIFGMIEKERFEKVLEEGSKLMNMSKKDFQRAMEGVINRVVERRLIIDGFL